MRKTPVSDAEVCHSLVALYKMYERGVCECDMRVVFETLKA